MRPKPGSLFMRFLARFGVLIGEGAMVIYSPPPIKMGGAWEKRGRASASSPRQAEDQKERAIQSFASVRIERSYNSPDPIAAKRIKLIGHDLGVNEQTVLYGWS